ncbi:hypothetical protein ABTJ14_19630, partial [Acinetobacter baumannii]
MSSNLTASAKFEKLLLKAGAFFISIILPLILPYIKIGTVAKLAMRQPFVLFKGLTFQKLCL